ncbi:MULTISPECIES: hypothetical protein [Planktothricoides]|uniref:Uncharacterized protein n=2 Tax=Planktothricoides raciborskii TaxID=132608 RepID=A0AAU8JFC3_9CYAN|nr:MULTISPECIES: hypothetical protein [Planktothricoides]KOR34179.1 hypothetical protein AM228_25690 [Planktothricoides sp. SR001]MBD2547314.1 hypothetical protein [Planktothricoides raciborskii FACHB-1370]MBD2585214.1 hypothetical protein [Planktothricoides raciborskii FACHB-1261]
MGDRANQKTGLLGSGCCCAKRNRVSVRHTTVNCDIKQETRFLISGLWVLVAAEKETGFLLWT